MLLALAATLAQAAGDPSWLPDSGAGRRPAEFREALLQPVFESSDSPSPPDDGPGPGGEDTFPGLGVQDLDLVPVLRVADAAPAWSVRVAPVLRRISGNVTVRENAVPGTRLDLGRDLGARTEAGLHVAADAEGPVLRLEMEFEEASGWGGRAARQTFNWNGTSFVAPAQVRLHSTSLVVLPNLTAKLLESPDRKAWLGPVAGLEYPYITVNVGTSRTKGSLEDWVHYLPYPALGVAGHLAISEALDLEGRVTASYLPNVPAPYTEGGRLYVSARPSVRLEVPLAYHLGSSVDLSLAFTYQYWSGRDHSAEDGNTLVVSAVGVWLGLAYTW